MGTSTLKSTLSASVVATVMTLMFLYPGEGNAQFYNGLQQEFGKSRIQYKEFLWTYYKFDDFDTYFYLNGQELAEKTAKYASLQIPLIERRLETALENKIQFIVFNNLTDLKQSNIGLSYGEHYNTGGVTHIVGTKVFLYFNGDMRHFEKQVRSGIANVLINQIMLGSNIGSQIKNNTLYRLPEWYTNGLLSYIGDEWNSEIDNRVRDGILSGRYEKFNNLTGEEATYAGHSLWKYVSDTYGSSSVAAIINMTQLSHNVENGFLYVVGVSYKKMLEDWLTYYREKYESEPERDLPENEFQKKVKKHLVYSRPTVSPDGMHVAFVTYDDGKYKIYIKNLLTGKRKRIFKGGFRLEEKIDHSYPLLAWHPNGRALSFIVEKKGEVYLYFYKPEEKEYQSVILYNFEKVLDFSFAHHGRTLLFSAVQLGQSDLYIYNISAGSHQQLTNDVYDDLTPRFLNNSSQIIFSSNRLSDTLEWAPENSPAEMPITTDLFIYDYSSRSPILKRVTSTPFSNETQPREWENGKFLFLSDRNGIYNRFAGIVDSVIAYVDTTVHYRYFSTTYPITDYARNILFHEVSPESGTYSESLLYNGLYYLFAGELVVPDEERSEELSNTDYRDEFQKKARMDEIEEEIKMQKVRRDFNKRFRNVFRKPEQQTPQLDDGQPGEIDINNYRFDRQAFVKLGKEPADSLAGQQAASSAGAEKKGFQLPKRQNYRVEYYINELTTQLDFTSLNYFYQPFGSGNSGSFYNLGLNGFFKVGLTDLLEDHRIVGGFRIPVSLNNIEYLFTYANLRKRLDKEIIFVRQASESEYYSGLLTFIQRFRSYQLYYRLKYPFSPVFAVRGTANIRYQRGIWLSTNEPALAFPNTDEYWGGLKGEFIYDNTKQLGPNLLTGMRFKVFGEYTQILGEDDKNMTVVGVDFRHYYRIHRDFIWANRFAASTSFGKNRLIYYMGGVDNWLAPKFEQNTPIDPNQDYAYQTLATNMRGFNQNARNGNNFFVINSELRFPVFRYFMNRPIKSDFLNSFQVIAFGDVGTAWSGRDPYSDENSLYTTIIRDGALYIIVREQKEPLIGGFGGGLRTRVFGYFLRGDIAWGVEDRQIKKPVFYISLSLDF